MSGAQLRWERAELPGIRGLDESSQPKMKVKSLITYNDGLVRGLKAEEASPLPPAMLFLFLPGDGTPVKGLSPERALNKRLWQFYAP